MKRGPVRDSHPFRGRDLTGIKFGRLTALHISRFYRRPSSAGKRVPVWKCQCECGKKTHVRGENLITGWTKSCGCLRPVKIPFGTKRGKLYFVRDLTEQRRHRRYVLCLCGCGKTKAVRKDHFWNGLTFSCGCHKKEITRVRMKRMHKKFIQLRWPNEKLLPS